MAFEFKTNPEAKIKFLGKPGIGKSEHFVMKRDAVFLDEMPCPISQKVGAPTFRAMVNVMEMDRVWVRPRCPNKWIGGRKGTRRQWKRANPPGFRLVSKTGKVLAMPMKMTPTMIKALEKLGE
jgi:hypothetical protein